MRTDPHTQPMGSEQGGASCDHDPLLQVQALKKHFRLKSRGADGAREIVRAVNGVDLEVWKGETLSIVGESGCGKSTMARLVVKLMDQDEGSIRLRGEDVDQPGAHGGARLRTFRKAVQMVFQDSYSSLNPRLTIEQAITFGLKVNGVAPDAASRIAWHYLDRVGLPPATFSQRYPHELSGGQRQRVNIARALALQPEIVVLDEAVSALDKTVEAQILKLLEDLKRELKLTYIFISHDLNVVEHISDRVAVMYLGRVVEYGSTQAIFNRPSHPYTQGLLASRLSMDPDIRIQAAPLTGDPPNPINPPAGCSFRTRCRHAMPQCAQATPSLQSVGDASTLQHQAACFLVQPGPHAAPAARSAEPLKEPSL